MRFANEPPLPNKPCSANSGRDLRKSSRSCNKVEGWFLNIDHSTKNSLFARESANSRKEIAGCQVTLEAPDSFWRAKRAGQTADVGTTVGKHAIRVFAPSRAQFLSASAQGAAPGWPGRSSAQAQCGALAPSIVPAGSFAGHPCLAGAGQSSNIKLQPGRVRKEKNIM